MPRYLTENEVREYLNVTKTDLAEFESKFGRKELIETFENYNPKDDDNPPELLIDALFGNQVFDDHWESHFVASDYILDIWNTLHKLFDFRKPKVQKLQSKWIRTRRAVFERDGYKCVICGINTNLCAHHVKPRSEYPELTYDISNIITLCKYCHAKEHPTHSSLILSRTVDQCPANR